MNFVVITIFPEMFTSFLKCGVLGKALDAGLIKVNFVNPRDFTEDKHRTVDDEPYGGGAGMVMKPEPLCAAIEEARGRYPSCRVILLSPKGHVLDQQKVKELSGSNTVALVCGRYEGIDERVSLFVDEELSIGDYVLSGGEVAAMVVIETVSRYIPGVLGCGESVSRESFSDGLLEYPQYTRPYQFRGMKVPEILRSGNHRAIEKWRRFQSIKETFLRRPDLLAKARLTSVDVEILTDIVTGKDWKE